MRLRSSAAPICGAAHFWPTSCSTARSSTPGVGASRIASLAWRRQLFERLATSADAGNDAARAIAAAERLVALDPTREDRARVALKIVARHRGRDAALERARLLTNLLRSELDVAPEAATRALVEEIRNGAIEPVQVEELVAADEAPIALSLLYPLPNGERVTREARRVRAARSFSWNT